MEDIVPLVNALLAYYRFTENTGTWQSRGKDGIDGSSWLLSLEEHALFEQLSESVDEALKGTAPPAP